MNGLDLFSGIGGITKALEGYVTPIAYCENDRYGMGVLLSRMASGDLPIAPIWDDIRTLKGYHIPHPIGLIYGRFPCQDISVAGRGAGLEGKRSGLFFEIARLIGEIRPRFVFLENVPAINRRGGDTVVGTLADLGYDARWDVLSARDVGANHRRERWWLLAHSHGDGSGSWRTECKGQQGRCTPVITGSRSSDVALTPCGQDIKRRSRSLGKKKTSRESLYSSVGNGGQDVADAKSFGLQQSRHSRERRPGFTNGGLAHSVRQRWCGSGTIESTETNRSRTLSESSRSGWWATEPNVGRVAHGIPSRVDRLRGLGNAVVPSQAREAFERLMGLK